MAAPSRRGSARDPARPGPGITASYVRFQAVIARHRLVRSTGSMRSCTARLSPTSSKFTGKRDVWAIPVTRVLWNLSTLVANSDADRCSLFFSPCTFVLLAELSATDT